MLTVKGLTKVKINGIVSKILLLVQVRKHQRHPCVFITWANKNLPDIKEVFQKDQWLYGRMHISYIWDTAHFCNKTETEFTRNLSNES